VLVTHIGAVAIPLGGPNEGIDIEVSLATSNGGFVVTGLRADVPAGP
jgi:hypothetical protein